MPFNFNAFGYTGGQRPYSPFNPIKRTTSSFGYNIDPYGLDEQQKLAEQQKQKQREDQQRQLQQQLEQLQQEEQPDFLSEYGKITSNRPQRLNYQKEVEKGAPQIPITKWKRLLGALTAGADAYSGDSVANAYKLGSSIWEEPQARSDARYKERIAGYANLANMEDSDIQDKLKTLETQRKDWYDKQNLARNKAADVRAETQLGFERDKNARDTTLQAMQIKNIESEMNKRDTDEWTDPTDGNHYKRKPGGQIELVGKYAQSEKEKRDAVVAQTEAVEKVKEPFDVRSSNRTFEHSKELENVRNTNRVEAAKVKAQADAAKLRDKAKSSTGLAKAQELALADAIENEPALQGVNLNEIVEKVGGVYKIKDNPGYIFGDSDEVAAAKARVGAVLKSINPTTVPAKSGWGTPIIR